MKDLIKFSSQVNKNVFKVIKKLTDEQGRKLQDVIDEALRDYIEKTKKGKPRQHVMDEFRKSLKEYDSLYKELAK